MKALMLALFVVAACASSVALAAPIDLYDRAPTILERTPALPPIGDSAAEPTPDRLPVPPMPRRPAPVSQLLTAIAIGTLFLWRLQAAHRPARHKPAMHW